MPYNAEGKWYLSVEANTILQDTEQDEKKLISAFIKSGDLEEGEFLRDLWQHGKDDWETTDWEADSELGSNWSKRYSVLQEYSKKYNTRVPGADQGMGMEREIGGQNLDFEDDTPELIMKKLMGERLGGKDYEIDYAHYNSNLAYRSTVAHMRKEFPDMRADFKSPAQIRTAQAILRGDGYDFDKEWVKQNAMPYTNGEIEALEDFKKHNVTRHFDKEYNITTYLDPQDSRALSIKLYDARKAGNYTRMEEPAAPEWLNIVGGTAPKEEYDSEGQRIVADGDVKAMYQRYLGRAFRIDAEDSIYAPEAQKGIKQSEIDYWEASALQNNWNYDDLVQQLKTSAEGLKNTDKGRIFYNPNQGKEAQIKSKLVAEPAAITPPSLTIRQLKGGIQKPSKQAGHSSNLDGFNVKKPVTGEAL
jgi:hypothetical protein